MEQDIIKSSLDPLTYKKQTLQNDLDILFIIDPNSKLSSASMMVQAGWLHDPQQVQGLAHFCEHMLFMGSTKYPIQNEYSSYISNNGGQYNASTGLLTTRYYFDCASHAFLGALDIFAQFFISPLFRDDCVDKEMNAVDSEFNLSLSDDESRMWEIYRKLAKGSLNTFGTGNLQTLKIPDIQEHLLKFYHAHYSSHLMKLVVYINNDQEISQICEIMKKIPKKDIQHKRHIENPFQGVGNIFYKVVSVKDENDLYLSWTIQKSHYKKKIDSFLTHILGYEGKLSLASFLRKQGQVVELCAGTNELNDQYQELYIQLQLTENGFNNWQEVVGTVLQYIEIIKKNGFQEYIYKDLQLMNHLDFHYKEKTSKIINYVYNLSKKMKEYPIQDILRVNYLYEEFDIENTKATLNQFTTDNLIVFLRSQNFEDQEWQTEELYKTKHQQFPLPKIQLINTDQMDVPQPNSYIPKIFDLLDPEFISPFPEKILETNNSSVWYFKDNRFQVCKCGIYLQIYPNQSFCYSAKERVLSELWLSLFSHCAQETVYEAECASIQTSLSLTYNSLKISVEGFTDNLVLYFKDYMKHVYLFHKDPQKYITTQIYEMYYEELEQDYENYFMKSPYDLTFSYLKCMLFKQGKFKKEDLLTSLQKCTIQDLITFTSNFLKNIRFEWFIGGNIHKTQTVQLVQDIESQWNVPPPKIEDLNVFQLKDQISIFQKIIEENDDEPNSGIIVYFQHKGSNKRDLKLDLICQLLEDPVEDQLRTNEQLGYVASVFGITRRGVKGFCIMIVSAVKSPYELSARIEDFLNKFDFENINEETFEKMKNGLKQQKSQDHQNLMQQLQDYWDEISLHSYQFNKINTVEKELNDIDLQSFKAFCKEVVGDRKKRLEIHVLCKNHKQQDKAQEKQIKGCQKVKNLKNFEHFNDFYRMNI